MRNHIHGVTLVLVAAALTACSSAPPSVRITRDKPVAAAPVAARHSEPVFYNGKTYRLDLASRGAGMYDMAISGMGPRQQKDAEAVATSSLGYFACPDGQRGTLQSAPAYANAKWHIEARCG